MTCPCIPCLCPICDPCNAVWSKAGKTDDGWRTCPMIESLCCSNIRWKHMIQSVIQGLRCLSVTCNIPQSCPAGDLCCILHLSFPSFPVFCLNKAHNAAKHTLKKTTMTLYLCMTHISCTHHKKKLDFLEPKAQLTSSWISSAGERHFDWFLKINIRIKYSSCGVCRVQTTCVFEPPSTTSHFWGNGSSAPSITHAPAAFRFVWSPLTNLNSPNYPRTSRTVGFNDSKEPSLPPDVHFPDPLTLPPHT